MFVIELIYKAELTEIDAHMADHMAFLNKHYAQGHFVVSGRKVPRDGGIIVNIAPLIVFKYTGFLYSNAAAVGNAFGAGWAPPVTVGLTMALEPGRGRTAVKPLLADDSRADQASH